MSGSINFRSRGFLLGHIRDTLAFYDPRVVDPAGGFFHCFMNDGRVFDPATRTLVASCRFVFNYAKAFRRFGKPDYLEWVRHGIAYLRQGRVLSWWWQEAEAWREVQPRGRLQMDDLNAITQAAIAGFGLAWLPTWLARPHLERGELREVLGALKGRSYPINALWPHSPHLPLKTRMAIDWLASRLPERLASVAGAGSHDQ